MGFENAEFYIKRCPELDGLRLKDVLISFPDAVPCGIKVAAEGGKIDINPDDDYVLKEGDEVLVIAEDDYVVDDNLAAEVIEEIGDNLCDSYFSYCCRFIFGYVCSTHMVARSDSDFL